MVTHKEGEHVDEVRDEYHSKVDYSYTRVGEQYA